MQKSKGTLVPRSIEFAPLDGAASGKRRGLARRTAIWAVVAGCAVIFAGGIWPRESLRAKEAPSKTDELAALCDSTQAWHHRAVALRDLAKLDTADSRKALEALADSKDERLAAQALATISRANQSGGDAKLKKVIEDTNRSDAARAFALSAWCRKEAKAGRSWSDVKSYVESKCEKHAALDDAAKASKKTLWGKE